MLELKQVVQKLISIDKVNVESAGTFIFKGLKREKKKLFITGTKHTGNFKDQQAFKLQQAFLKSFNDKDDVMILCLEGSLPREDIGTDNSEAIVSKVGEVGLIVKEAKERGFEVKSIEPSFQEVAKWAFEIQPDAQAFSAWALLNLLSSIGEDEKGVDAKHAPMLQKALTSIGKQYDVATEYEMIYSKIQNYLLTNTSVSLPDTFEKLFSQPLPHGAVVAAQRPGESLPTNRAATSFNLARDYGLMKNTIDIFENTDRSLFVWMGLNHVLSQLPAYEYLGFKEIK